MQNMTNWQKIDAAYSQFNKRMRSKLVRRLLSSVMGLVPFDHEEIFRLLGQAVESLEAQAEGLGSAMDFRSGGRGSLAQFDNYQMWMSEVDSRLQKIIEEFKIEELMTKRTKSEGLDK